MKSDLKSAPLISLQVDKQRNRALLSLRGILGIQQASDLKSYCLKGFEEVQEVEIDLQSLEEVDAAIIQVLFSIKDFTKGSDKSIIYPSPLPTSVVTSMTKIGFSDEQIKFLTA